MQHEPGRFDGVGLYRTPFALLWQICSGKESECGHELTCIDVTHLYKRPQRKECLVKL